MKRPTPPPRLLVLACFAAIYLVWGSTYAAIRLAVETMPPFLMAASRFLIAGLLLYAVARLGGAPAPTARQWRGAAAVGTLMLVTGSGVLCWAEQSVPSGLAAAMLATVPMWTAVLDWRLFAGPRPRTLALVGIVIGIGGVARLAGGGGVDAGELGALGPLAILAAAGSWSVGGLLSRRVDQPRSAFLAVAMQMLWAGAVLAVAAGVRGEVATALAAPPTAVSGLAWAYLIVVGTLITLVAYVWLLRTVRPALVSTYAFVNPVIALLIGWLALGEGLTRSAAIGAGLVVVAVTMVVAANLPQPTGQRPGREPRIARRTPPPARHRPAA
jgi:drug/metabolite transporter (DMT)-like permease